MDASKVEQFFAKPDGGYAFARWNRPIAPVIFGVEDQSLPVLKGAIEAIAQLAGVEVVEVDPELGSNCMCFFLRDWEELTATKDMDRLVPDLANVVKRLQTSDASVYRFFRYDKEGGIRAAFLFLRMTEEMASQAAEVIALTNAVQIILTWGGAAFDGVSPLAVHPENGAVVLKPEYADLIRAAYDPVMPVSTNDPTHAMRLAARISR